jgi:hypothetical protein
MPAVANVGRMPLPAALLELRIGTANGLIGSQQLDLNDETYLESLLGSVASEPLHLQVLVLL